MRVMLSAVAALLAMTTAAAQPLPDDLRSAPITVAEYQQYNEELELVRALARQRSADARIALARLFVERAQSARAEGLYDLAFRYLIAGARVSPQNSPIFRAGLAQAVDATNDYFEVEDASWAQFYDAREGSFLVGRQHNVELWNGRTRALVRAFAADDRVEGERNPYTPSLSADRSRLIVFGDVLDTVAPLRLWNVDTGALIRRYDYGAVISAARFSPDGRSFVMRVIYRDEDRGEFQLLRASDGAELAVLHACCHASFSEDSKVVAVADWNRVLVADAGTGAMRAEIDLRPLLPAEVQGIRRWAHVELSPDGSALLLMQDLSRDCYVIGLSGAAAPALRLSPYAESLEDTANRYVRAAFLGWADASRMLVSLPGEDGALAYVNARSGGVTPARFEDLDTRSRAFLRVLEDGETSSLVRNLDTGETTEVAMRILGVSDRFDLVLTLPENYERNRPGHSDRIVRTLDGRQIARLPGHNLFANHELVEWRAHALLTEAGPDMRFWPNDEGRAEWRAASGAEIAALAQRYEVDLTATHSQRVETHNAVYVRRGDGALISILGANPADIERARANPTPDGIGAVMASAPHDVFTVYLTSSFDAGHTRVAVTDQQRAGVYDVASGRPIFTPPPHGADDTFWDVALSPDGRLVVVSCRDSVSIYDVDSGRLVRARPAGALRSRFTPDGQSIVSLDGGAITIWSRRTGETMSVLRTEREVSDFALSPNGQFVLVRHGDHGDEWVLWDVATRKKLGELIVASRGNVRFADDGEAVLAFERNYGAWGDVNDDVWEVREWDIRRLVQPLNTLMRDACAYYLEERSFSAEEIEADPLIREVWGRDGRADRDVCEGLV